MRFQKRAHNPLLLAAGFAQTDVAVPWLGKQAPASGIGLTRRGVKTKTTIADQLRPRIPDPRCRLGRFC